MLERTGPQENMWVGNVVLGMRVLVCCRRGPAATQETPAKDRIEQAGL